MSNARDAEGKVILLRQIQRSGCADMEHPFDWAAWNAQFDAGQAALKQSLERWNEAEAELAKARVEMARDVRRIIGEVM